MTVALVAGTRWLLTKDSTTKGSDIATVLGLPVAILSLLAAVVAIVVAVRPGRVEGDVSADAARRLAGAVRAREEATLARLVADIGETHPADVGFAQPALLHWRTDGGSDRGSLAQIKSYYQGLRRGRLVVLGQAGAGKTVLATTLVRDLAATIVDTPLSSQEAGRRVVVPVRLSLPAFNLALGEDNPDNVPAEQVAKQLEQWLAGHLLTVYGVGETTGTALVTQGWVLPVLDGLDEMDPPGAWPAREAAVLRALNHPTPVGLRPMVVTCRTGRYAQLTGHFDLAADRIGPEIDHGGGSGGETLVVQDTTVVSIEPLTVPNVIAYLNYRFPDPARSGGCEPRWHPIADRLATNADDDPLVAALRSPLRLFLATTGYLTPDSDPNVLTRYTTTAQLDDHLFELLIPATTAQHPRRSGGHYSAPDVQRWLSTLAHYLNREDQAGRSGSDLQLDELWRIAGDRARYLAAAALTTASAAAWLMISRVGYLVQVGQPHGVRAVSDVVVGVVVVAATAWSSLGRFVDLRRVDPSVLRTSAARRRVVVGLVSGLVVGLVGGVGVGLVNGFAVGLVVVPVAGLMVGLMSGLMQELEVRPAAIDLPHRLVSQGLVHMAARFTFGLTSGLAVGFALGLAGGLAGGFAGGLAGGLAVGLAGGLAVGIILMANSPWPRYAVGCLLSARRGGLPPYPAAFLDWAYDAGLVRLSGIAVQFRHREFQAWLTTHGEEFRSPAPPSPPAGASAPVGR